MSCGVNALEKLLLITADNYCQTMVDSPLEAIHTVTVAFLAVTVVWLCSPRDGSGCGLNSRTVLGGLKSKTKETEWIHFDQLQNDFSNNRRI